jgi:hypothetical protein
MSNQITEKEIKKLLRETFFKTEEPLEPSESKLEESVEPPPANLEKTETDENKITADFLKKIIQENFRK